MKDQTNKEFKEQVKGKEDVSLGVGLVCHEVDGKIIKRVLHDLTYNKIVEVAEKAEAFKFIPYGVDILIQGEFRFLKNADSFPEEWFQLG